MGSIRRQCNDRICLFTSVLLVFYILWYTSITPYYTHQIKYDVLEKLVYLRALNSTSPIIQNPQICSLDDVDLLLIILSSSSHFLERHSIRETWGSMPDLFGVHSQRLFIIGYHSNGNFYSDLLHEAAHEQDILYLTVNDHSNTLKELYTYRWLEQHCSKVKYIFKTEDDLFVNTILLHELIRELKIKTKTNQTRYLYNTSIELLTRTQESRNINKFLFGWAFQSSLPERNLTISPYYITYDEYPKEMYPRYCSGFGYLMNLNTRNLLTNESFHDKNPFRFSDIYITGILPERLNFVCDVLPFIYHQGSIDQCIELIQKNNQIIPSSSTSSPLLLCSTGRHIGQRSYSDYYTIWTQLRHVYADRLH